MRLMKPFLWTVFGVILGMAGSFSTGHVQAQSAAPQEVEKRLVVKPASGPAWVRMYFVSDPKSGGCWLASYATDSSSFASMAVAPPSACVIQ